METQKTQCLKFRVLWVPCGECRLSAQTICFWVLCTTAENPVYWTIIYQTHLCQVHGPYGFWEMCMDDQPAWRLCLQNVHQALVVSSENPVGTAFTQWSPFSQVQVLGMGNLQQMGMLPGSLAKGCTSSAAEGTQLLPHMGGYQRLKTMWEIVYWPSARISSNIPKHVNPSQIV